MSTATGRLQTYGVKLEQPERTNEVAGQYAAAVVALGKVGMPLHSMMLGPGRRRSRALAARAGGAGAFRGMSVGQVAMGSPG